MPASQDHVDPPAAVRSSIRDKRPPPGAEAGDDEEPEADLTLLESHCVVSKFVDFLTGSNLEPSVEILHTDPLAISFTSGTTGPSKGVLATHCHVITFAMDWITASRVRGPQTSTLAITHLNNTICTEPGLGSWHTRFSGSLLSHSDSWLSQYLYGNIIRTRFGSVALSILRSAALSLGFVAFSTQSCV